MTRTSRNVSYFLTLLLLTRKTEICLAGDKLQRRIRSWLSPPDPWKNYNIAHRSRHSGTGAWFVQGDTLSEWKASGPSSLLWIHGKRELPPNTYPFAEIDGFPLFVAGSGKSVLWYVSHSIFPPRGLMLSDSSTIIEEIDTMRKSGLASLAVLL